MAKRWPTVTDADRAAIARALRKLRNIRGGPGIHVANTPTGVVVSAVGAASTRSNRLPVVYRMKVTNAAPSGYDTLVLAKFTDVNGTYGEDWPVLFHSPRTADAEFIAVRPDGGVAGGTTYAGEIVEWEQVNVPYVKFEVTVTQTGGSAGTSSTACTFTYTATSLDSTQLGTVLSPAWARWANGKMVAATHGEGYMNPSGVFVLSRVDEVPDTGACT